MMQSISLSPAELGLPEKFTAFRPSQQDAIARINDYPGRYIAISMPTGGGKSLLYIASALFAGYRAVVLTSTKALQSQLIDDFGAIGLEDVRGRQNFQCLTHAEKSCEIGATMGCRKAGACPYRAQLEIARQSQLVVTNLSYWMAINHHSDGLGDFDLLIIDEAHEAPESVCSMAAVEITDRDITTLLRVQPPMDLETPGSWSAWAEAHLPNTRCRVESFAQTLRSGMNVSDHDVAAFAAWRALEDKLHRLVTMTGSWAVEVERHRYRIEPLLPSEHAERLLYLGISRVMLVSATMTPKTLTLMGLPDPYKATRIAPAAPAQSAAQGPAQSAAQSVEDSILYLEYPSDFPVQRNYLTHVPTVNVRASMGEGEIAHWVRQIDSIIRGRLDRKGIIHTTSYARVKEVMNRSEFAWMMLEYKGSKDAERAIEAFKTIDQPCILIGPSITTGYDFPGTACEYQILCKVPFPDTRSPILKARCELDKSYGDYLTMQTLVQTCGRAMRFKMDSCENFIVDDNIRWFMSRNAATLAPKWFRRTYRSLNKIPPAATKLPG